MEQAFLPVLFFIKTEDWRSMLRRYKGRFACPVELALRGLAVVKGEKRRRDWRSMLRRYKRNCL